MTTILVGVDPADRHDARDAVLLAGLLAATLDGPVHAVTVYEPADDEAGGRRRAEEAVTELLRESAVEGSASAFPGRSAARVLHYLADRERADCVVIGAGHAGRPGRTCLGAVGEPLLHGSAVPVAIAPRGYGSRTGRLDPVGVAYGGTPESDEAVRHARTLAERAGAKLRVLVAAEPAGSADTPEAMRRLALERLERALGAAGDGAEGVIVDGDPAEALAHASADLDLLIAGSRSYGPLRVVLLGAVTRRLVGAARCPVMVVPRLPDAAHEVALVGGMDVALST